MLDPDKVVEERSGEVVKSTLWRSVMCSDVPPQPCHDEFWYAFTLRGVSEGKVKVQPKVKYKSNGGGQWVTLLGPEFHIEVRGFVDLRFDSVGEWGEEIPGGLIAEDWVEQVTLKTCGGPSPLLTLTWNSDKIGLYTDPDCGAGHKVVEDVGSVAGSRQATFQPDGTWTDRWEASFVTKLLWVKGLEGSAVARDIQMKLTDSAESPPDGVGVTVVELDIAPDPLYIPAAAA